MDRRTLMAGASAALIARRAEAQPVPLWGPAGATQTLGPGPLSAVPSPALALDFMNPGTLDARISFSRASTGTYTDAGGVIRTAVSNAPRWDFANGVLRGMLTEEQRTNYCLQSSNLSAAPWASSSAFGPAAPVVTGNNAVAPDGTTTATKIDLPACSAGGLVQVYQNIGLTAAFTFSMYLRGAVGGEQTYLIISGTSYVSLRVTLTTQWQRFVVTGPAFASGAYALIGTDLRDGAQSATPAGTVYAWGAQIEQGTFATSCIPTASVSVTRAADIAVVPTDVSWFAPATFSYALEFYMFAPIAGANGGFSDNAFGENTWYFSGGYASNKIGTNGGSATAGNPILGAVNKQCGTFNVTQVKTATNASGVGKYSAAMVAPVGAVRLAIADAPWAPGGGNVHIRRAQVWTRVLSDSEMQQVTR